MAFVNIQQYNTYLHNPTRNKAMSQEQICLITTFFKIPTNNLFEHLLKLIEESIAKKGLTQTIDLLPQWQVLSKKLNTTSKLYSLSDKNHRAMIIELIHAETIHLYNSSYFNHAKISPEQLSYLNLLGPYVFIEVIMIVSKLKIIYKHFYQELDKNHTENHILLKIKQILNLCANKKRSINNNLNKFKSIVQFEEDRQNLTKELGKMLREAWKKEKGKGQVQVYEKEESVKLKSVSDIQLNNNENTPKESVKGYFFEEDQKDQYFGLPIDDSLEMEFYR